MPFGFNNNNRMFSNDGSVNQSYSSNSMFNPDGTTNANYNPYAQNKTFGFAGNNNYNINDVSSYPQIQEANQQFNNAMEVAKTPDMTADDSKSPSQMGMLYAMGALGNMSPMQGNMEYYGNTLGRGMNSGNAGQIIGGGLGMALSGVKSVMAGAGAQNISNFLQKEGMRKYRQAVEDKYGQENLSNYNTLRTMGYFADGGEMPQEQQQVTPDMIIQAYAQMQGMNEQQVQMLMQELDQLSPEEQQQAIQQMAMQVQGAQEQMAQQQNAQAEMQEPQQEAPQQEMMPEEQEYMAYGGKLGLFKCGGKKMAKGGMYDNYFDLGGMLKSIKKTYNDVFNIKEAPENKEQYTLKFNPNTKKFDKISKGLELANKRIEEFKKAKGADWIKEQGIDKIVPSNTNDGAFNIIYDDGYKRTYFTNNRTADVNTSTGDKVIGTVDKNYKIKRDSPEITYRKFGNKALLTEEEAKTLGIQWNADTKSYEKIQGSANNSNQQNNKSFNPNDYKNATKEEIQNRLNEYEEIGAVSQSYLNDARKHFGIAPKNSTGSAPKVRPSGKNTSEKDNIRDYQNFLNILGGTDYENSYLKTDGKIGPRTQSVASKLGISYEDFKDMSDADKNAYFQNKMSNESNKTAVREEYVPQIDATNNMAEQVVLGDRIMYDAEDPNAAATEQDYIDQGYSENVYKTQEPKKRRKLFGIFAEGGEMNEIQDEMMEEKLEMSKLSIRKDKKGTQIIVEKEETPITRQEVIAYKRWLNDNGMSIKIDGKLDASTLKMGADSGLTFEMFKEQKMESEENMQMYGGRIKDNIVEYKPLFKKK